MTYAYKNTKEKLQKTYAAALLKKKLYNQPTNAKVYQHHSVAQLLLHNTSRVFSVVRNVHMVSALSWYAGSWKCVIHQCECKV